MDSVLDFFQKVWNYRKQLGEAEEGEITAIKETDPGYERQMALYATHQALAAFFLFIRKFHLRFSDNLEPIATPDNFESYINLKKVAFCFSSSPLISPLFFFFFLKKKTFSENP